MTSIPGVALLGVVACLAAATVIADDEFECVNRLRVQAGLDRLQPDPHLAEAARRHANYLDRHREPGSIAHGVSAHVESAGDQRRVTAAPAGEASARRSSARSRRRMTRSSLPCRSASASR